MLCMLKVFNNDVLATNNTSLATLEIDGTMHSVERYTQHSTFPLIQKVTESTAGL